MNQTSYGAESRVFLAQAIEELERDDLRQASEKGWGAAAEILKAVAAERGWAHQSHRALYGIVDTLVEETGDQDLRRQFATAGHTQISTRAGLAGQPWKLILATWRVSLRGWSAC